MSPMSTKIKWYEEKMPRKRRDALTMDMTILRKFQAIFDNKTNLIKFFFLERIEGKLAEQRIIV